MTIYNDDNDDDDDDDDYNDVDDDDDDKIFIWNWQKVLILPWRPAILDDVHIQKALLQWLWIQRYIRFKNHEVHH